MARGSGHRLPSGTLGNNIPTTAIKPVALSHYQSNNSISDSAHRGFSFLSSADNQTMFTSEMLQNNESFKFSRFENALKSNYIDQKRDSERAFSEAKEEPRDDMFFESLLC